MMFGFQGLSLYTDCIACPGLSRIVLITMVFDGVREGYALH